MLETLSRGFRNARLKLQGKGTISPENVAEAIRDVRVSLLEADVELGVVREFLERVQGRAVGEVVPIRSKKGGISATPADHFIKICHEELVALMGEGEGQLLMDRKPSAVMMVGLQGSGKTTTAGKLARLLLKQGKKPMLVAADIYRPAAVDQLTTIGRKVGVPVFFIKGMDPVALCTLAMDQARSVGRDVVIFDTAGRLAIDNALMDELVQIREKTDPENVLFVCDSMIGQDAVRTAAEFDRRLDFSGFVLTKLDGDARGGAALSIRKVTGKPIAFVGMGEGLDKLETFRADGLAGRILGMGDVVGLVRSLEDAVDRETAEQDAEKLVSGDFSFDSFVNQIRTIRKMGSLKDLMGKIPMLSNMLDQIPEEALDDRELNRIEAMVQSMTPEERARPDVLNSSRIRRIARGAGRKPEDVKALYDRFLMARQAMRQVGQASGLFGSLKQSRKARKLMEQGGMSGGLAGLGDVEPASDEPRVSPEERAAKRKKQQQARKARRRNRR